MRKKKGEVFLCGDVGGNVRWHAVSSLVRMVEIYGYNVWFHFLMITFTYHLFLFLLKKNKQTNKKTLPTCLTVRFFLYMFVLTAAGCLQSNFKPNIMGCKMLLVLLLVDWFSIAPLNLWNIPITIYVFAKPQICRNMFRHFCYQPNNQPIDKADNGPTNQPTKWTTNQPNCKPTTKPTNQKHNKTSCRCPRFLSKLSSFSGPF